MMTVNLGTSFLILIAWFILLFHWIKRELIQYFCIILLNIACDNLRCFIYKLIYMNIYIYTYIRWLCIHTNKNNVRYKACRIYVLWFLLEAGNKTQLICMS